MENPEARVHSADLSECTNRLTHSSWHSAVDLVVVLGAEERRLMTSTLFTVSEKSMGFPPLVSLSLNGHGQLATVRGSIVPSQKNVIAGT